MATLAAKIKCIRGKRSHLGTSTGELKLPPLEAHNAGGLVFHFNHAGDRLLSTDGSGFWRLWDTRTGRLLLTQGKEGIACRTADQDDGLVGVGVTINQGLYFFRFRSGSEYCTLVHSEQGYADQDIGGRQLDRDGRLLTVPVLHGIEIVDVVFGDKVAMLPLAGNALIAVEPSGALLTHGICTGVVCGGQLCLIPRRAS